MAGIGDVGILFKIKADSDQAEREFKKFKKELDDIDERGKDPLQRLASQAGLTAAQFSGLQTAVLGATAIIGAIGIAAVTAATGIFRLTVAASEYGSEIFDATQKTGVGAETMSALRYAAEQSGSSFEKISGSVAKFSTLIGQAEVGNEKAADTLELYGITARNTEEALAQAVQKIGEMTDENIQSAASASLFKDKTGEVLNVIKSLKGNLPATIAELKKMGLTMSDEAAQAADDFGDRLNDLQMQAAATGRAFATELMPMMTQAMSQISAAMAANQGVAEKWGRFLVDTARGVGVAFWILRESVASVVNFISMGFASMSNQVIARTAGMTAAIYALLGPLGALAALGKVLGSATGGVTSGVDSTVNSILGQVQAAGSINIPKIRGGGGGGGGGAAGGGAAKQDTSVSDAQERDRKILENFKASSEQMIAENDRKLAAMEIDEREHLAELYRIKLAELDFERSLLEQQLNLAKLTAKEREDIEQRIGIIRTARRTEEIREKREITLQDLKDLKELDDILERMHKAVMARLEREQKKHDELQRKKDAAAKAEYRRKINEREGLFSSIGIGGTPDAAGQMILDPFKRTLDYITSLGPNGLPMQIIGQFAQGIGQLVQQFVLLGSAGPNATKKLVASVLASVAAQAAVQAIMFTAYGIAALTPWGAAIYGPAAPWFKAAATMAIIAASAGGIGRAVAGNSFNETASSAGSGGVGNGASQNNNFTTRFNGFGNAMGEQIRQQNQVIAALEETITRFDRKFNTASPGAVVMAGANEASRAIVGALHSEYSDNPASVDGTMRNLGFAR